MRKRGFTLVELMVVLAIMAIIIGIAVPSIINYRKLAEFRKNESNAKTVYLAAESRLAYYRSSGQWDSFRNEVEEKGQPAQLPGENGTVTKSDRIYGIVLNGDGDAAVRELLEGYTYDQELMNAGIAIEIDIESGQVYSAFYGTRCTGLDYSAEDHEGTLTMQKRSYEERKPRLLGYYSVEDTVNVVDLKPKRLKITSINLMNSETLTLNWSGNAGSSSLDADYELKFYQKGQNGDADCLLFGVTVSPYTMRQNGWTSDGMVSLPVTKADGSSSEDWSFPVSIQDGKYVLTLDAMMSAEVTETMQQTASVELLKTSSVSITRLVSVAEALKEPQNIYATVKAVANYNAQGTTTTDYRASEEVTSNEANTMFADDSTSNNIKIAAFRHLSNIRYYTKEENITFTLTGKNMDWISVGTGVYDFATVSEGESSYQKLEWKENQKDHVQDFPTVPLLKANDTLTGDGENTRISNLRLGEDSVIKDTAAEKLSGTGKSVAKAEYLGLFGEIEGSVSNLYFQNPYLELTGETTVAEENEADSTDTQAALQPVADHGALKGVGILAGRCQGTLKNIQVQKTKTGSAVVCVALAEENSGTNQKKAAAVGGIVGILAGKSADGSLTVLTKGTFSGLKMNGTVEGSVPGIKFSDNENTAEDTALSGIGGIIGYAWLQGSTADTSPVIEETENHAAVSGNQYTGGIVGNLCVQWQGKMQPAEESKAVLKNSTSDGLILCTAEISKTTTEGHYFGGIAGYADKAVMDTATTASGRAESFSYDFSKKNLLKGKYVGGIVGYGRGAILRNCSTQKNGYILGKEEVGGIIGALDEDSSIHASGAVKATTNVSYVIGEKYVGGIVGHNAAGTIANCINNGVVAGYKTYVGGITGANGEVRTGEETTNTSGGATIQDCASYLSDYDSSIFRKIVNDWKATAHYAGGITGYNNGRINFDNNSESIVNKSVSSIVVGENYVGGIAGFNDVDGTLDVHYTLIGGRIYAYGSCAGGAFGFNASPSVLTADLTLQPQSVRGTYYVGGIIGANVVKLSNNVTMNFYRADNRLGSVTAEAFCGGIMGYHRTYDDNISTTEGLTKLLPGLDEDNVPGKVSNVSNKYKLIINTGGGDDAEKKTINTLPIRAYLYAGGVVGFCEAGSNVQIEDCINEGSIAFPASGTFADSSAADGALLDVFAKSRITDSSLPNEAEDLTLHLAGGIVGVNLTGQTIQNCANKGSISGFSGAGGIVGLNAGTVSKCALTDSFGNVSLSYIGGIVGLNIGTTTKNAQVKNCTTAQGKTVSGKNYVGGIVGWNLPNATLQDNTSQANINAAGDAAGGIVGRNAGILKLSSDSSTGTKTVSGKNGVGGIVGINDEGAVLSLTSDSKDGVVVTGSGVSVSGQEKVGGIVGENHGNLGQDNKSKLICAAASVRAASGYAGGIAGWTAGNITNTENRSGSVSADKGNAGGITAVSQAKHTISNSTNTGNVTASQGYAGGIAAENAGTIQDCTVKPQNNGSLTIQSRGVKEAGAVSAVNTGTISGSAPSGSVVLDCDGLVFGGITGRNQGTVQNTTIGIMPTLTGSTNGRTVGGAVGVNEGTIETITANLEFGTFSGYTYLGGIAGQNAKTDERNVTIKDCSFSGSIGSGSKSAEAAAGNCYGGITGLNQAVLEKCSVGVVQIYVKGTYSATSTSTAAEKEQLASHVGGIAGKNDETATITGCTLKDTEKSTLCAKYGMLGGVTGFNKGAITKSGSEKTTEIMTQDDLTVEMLHTNATKAGLQADSTYVNTTTGNQIEKMAYYNDSNAKVWNNRLRLFMDSNGNLGGITAYNSTTGSVDYCVSGNWFLANKSDSIGVGTGGIIGMNESEKDLSYLVNGAFIGRQLSDNATNRFAGGIIGNQNNSTSNGWTIKDCLNYGTVYCYKTHYSGGILGQWTGTGGTIEDCRNYGNLQTTYGTGWVGASGGIVAQLYHAYEDHEYNIISCGNYGNIYTAYGKNTSNGANDSAGILGNVTTYDQSPGQKFTIQILDCFNAPGVEIYSASMASGIFGFLSCDNTNNIPNATANVIIRIERCRNFAKTLNGQQFRGGIFGDRRGSTGFENTVVKDCVSLNATNSGYQGYPIFSNAPGVGADVFHIGETNRSGNYYIDNSSTTEIETKEERNTTTGTNVNVASDNGSNGLNGRYAYHAYFMKNLTRNQYMIAYICPGSGVNGKWAYLAPDWYIKSADEDALIGGFLFYVDQVSQWDDSIKTDADNTVFTNARSSWRRLEGIDESNKLCMPQNVTVNITGGKMTVTVTPQTLSGSDKKCDPFLYEVKISEDGKDKIYKLYTEKGSFTLPSEFSTSANIQVRAVSMYDDVEPSDWYIVGEQDISRILPTPDIRVTLVETGNAPYTEPNQYAYRFSLNNLEDYQRTEENGNPLYPNWQVSITIPGQQSPVILNATNPMGTWAGGSNMSMQLTAKATATNTDIIIQDSGQVSISVSMPKYLPSLSLQTTDNKKVTPTVSVTGTTQDDLSITVTLDASKANATDTPPVYRAELVGTWKDTNGTSIENTIFAKTDLLLVSKGSVSGTFSNLPEYLKDATDLKIRIWYAASGLGPVYTWYDLGSSLEEITDQAKVNLKELISVDSAEDGTVTEEWSYGHSSVLSSTDINHYFGRYRYDSDTLFSWLPAPVLEGADAEIPMNPDEEVLKDGKVEYTFTWDQNAADTENASYTVTLTGLDAEGNRVLIDLGDAYKGGKSLTVDASDWSYQQVELKVTRIGDTTGVTKQIGLSTTGTYQLKQRLAQPGQPSIENVDVNEFDYQLTWAANSDEAGCSGYQAYIRMYDENGQLGETEALFDTPVSVDQKQDGTYQQELTLKEEWAGKKAAIYLVAKAQTDSSYLDSTDGIYYELTIPERITKPKVIWSPAWETGADKAETADTFRDGLKLSLKGDVPPPGGSAYLLKGYIYDSQDDAEEALHAGDPTANAIATYPAMEEGENVIPEQMEASGDGYEHTMSGLSIVYAGKYMVFYTRISSGSSGKLSSAWVASEPIALPYVQLDTPGIASDSEESNVTVTVKGKNPDIPDDTVEQEWTITNTILTWTAIECAENYQVKLIDSDDAEHEFTIPAQDESLKEYAITIEDGYTDQNGDNLTYSLEVKASLRTKTLEDGSVQYTLILPDILELKDEDDVSVTNDSFKKTSKAVFTAAASEESAYVTSEEATVNWD